MPKPLKLSQYGQQITASGGILQLMQDITEVLKGGDVCMLGGGNPAVIPEVSECYRAAFADIINDAEQFSRIYGTYSSPLGDNALREALADRLSQDYGWSLSAENICLTNGSQSAFFQLFNLFGGKTAQGDKQRILLPMAPEYLGYDGSSIEPDTLLAYQPKINQLGEREFKYQIDFSELKVGADIGALCLSRPSNPTGNVVTDQEVAQVDQLCRQADIPFILDSAYGAPFPNIIHTQATPHWNDNTILLLSLSKLGLPAVRTGIAIANRDVIKRLEAMNAVLNLAPTSPAAAALAPLFANAQINHLSRTYIQPYYANQVAIAQGLLKQYGSGLPLRWHRAEGAIFLWLWMPDLPIHVQTLYERLKARKVLIVPGHHFFPGIDAPQWRHQQECLRVSIAQPEAVMQRGIKVLCEEIHRAFEDA